MLYNRVERKGGIHMVEITKLVKRYDRKLAVDGISLKIQPGEIFGLLGPNGAGKSTTIHLICGLLKPDEGTIRVNGMSIQEQPMEAKRQLGLVPQEIAIFDALTVKENVTFFGKLSGLRGNSLKERVSEALSFTGLLESSGSLPKTLSGGMKRRLNIACAIVHQPKLIIMDEPTVGIDPQSRNHILEAVKRLNSQGSTIIYTSHYMEEVEAVCSRIGIMDHGRMLALGTKDSLKELVANEEKIQMEVADLGYNALEEIKAIRGVKGVQHERDLLEAVVVNSQLVLQDMLYVLSQKGLKVRGIKLFEPDLESVFLSLTGRSLRD